VHFFARNAVNWASGPMLYSMDHNPQSRAIDHLADTVLV
jgi:hypothetical protein